MQSHINVGTGEDLTIAELARLVARRGRLSRARIEFDTSKPDGTPRKLLDVSRIRSAGLDAQDVAARRHRARLRRFLQRRTGRLRRRSAGRVSPTMQRILGFLDSPGAGGVQRLCDASSARSASGSAARTHAATPTLVVSGRSACCCTSAATASRSAACRSGWSSRIDSLRSQFEVLRRRLPRTVCVRARRGARRSGSTHSEADRPRTGFRSLGFLVDQSGRVGRWLLDQRQGTPHRVLPVFSNVGEPHRSTPTGLPRLVVFGSAGVRANVYQWARRRGLPLRPEAAGLEIHDIGPAIAGRRARPAASCRKASSRTASCRRTRSASALVQRSCGALAYPTDYVSKSGVFAAYCAHGICPVLLSKDYGAHDGLTANVHYAAGFAALEPSASTRAPSAAQRASGMNRIASMPMSPRCRTLITEATQVNDLRFLWTSRERPATGVAALVRGLGQAGP